jgi:hypothetical protein
MGHFLRCFSLKAVSFLPAYGILRTYRSENSSESHAVGMWNGTDLARVLSSFPSTEHIGCNAGRAVLGLAALLQAEDRHLHFLNQCGQHTSFRSSAPSDNGTHTACRVCTWSITATRHRFGFSWRSATFGTGSERKCVEGRVCLLKFLLHIMNVTVRFLVRIKAFRDHLQLLYSKFRNSLLK